MLGQFPPAFSLFRDLAKDRHVDLCLVDLFANLSDVTDLLVEANHAKLRQKCVKEYIAVMHEELWLAPDDPLLPLSIEHNCNDS